MSKPLSCPMGHSASGTPRTVPQMAPTSAVVSSSQAGGPVPAARTHEHRMQSAAPAVSGWWAYCAQASFAEA